MQSPRALARLIPCALALFAAFAPAARAQTNNYVSSTGNVSLSSAATAATLQQPATNAKSVALQWASVYCSAACVATQSITGTAATATAGTPVAVPGNVAGAAVATFWTASNAGSGTTIAVDNIPAGGTFTFDLSKIRLPAFGTTSNYTISIASVTATVNIKIAHGELQ